jgi:hypothetical protein
LISNPANDSNGHNCCQNQTDKNVWYLAGTFGGLNGTRGGHVERACTISSQLAILFPSVVKVSSTKEFSASTKPTIEVLRLSASTGEIDNVTTNDVNVDGTKLSNSQTPRVQSQLFSFSYPEVGAAFEADSGFTEAFCDGRWVFLKPLDKGDHTISFYAEHPEPGGGTFVVDVEYNLKIT